MKSLSLRVCLKECPFTFHVALPAWQLLLLLWWVIEDHDHLFVMAELSHLAGISVLGIKIHARKSVAGNELAGTQESRVVVYLEHVRKPA